MSIVDKYYDKYKSIEASIQDLPPRPRVSYLLYLGYSISSTAIILKGAHWAYFAVTTVVFLLIYYDISKRIGRKQGGGSH